MDIQHNKEQVSSDLSDVVDIWQATTKELVEAINVAYQAIEVLLLSWLNTYHVFKHPKKKRRGKKWKGYQPT